jgi:thiosulfate dehydrogenase (quinone) large subunit
MTPAPIVIEPDTPVEEAARLMLVNQWLIIRVFLGFQWLDAGLHKVSDLGWMETGAALQGYWARAVAIPETGRPTITFDWYRSFLQSLLDSGSYV